MENKNDLIENTDLIENIDLIEKKNESKRNSKIIWAMMVVIPVIIAILSLAVFSGYATSAKFHSETIHSLQEKQNTVLKISATSATIAASASLLLGDRANAVSGKLLDLTGYFVIILCAIMLEKYLVTVMGMVSFQVLIPAACIAFSIFTLYNKAAYRKMAIRIFVFAVVMFLVIPFSVSISSLIEKTYNEANMQQIINEGDTLKEELDKEIDNINNNAATEKISETTNEINNENEVNTKDNDGNILGALANLGKGIANVASGAKDKVVETVGGAVSIVKDKANKLIDKLTSQLNKMIETIAVMLVTTCVIPVLVILFFVWLVKMLFSVEINVDMKKMPKLSKMVGKK